MVRCLSWWRWFEYTGFRGALRTVFFCRLGEPRGCAQSSLLPEDRSRGREGRRRDMQGVQRYDRRRCRVEWVDGGRSYKRQDQTGYDRESNAKSTLVGQ